MVLVTAVQGEEVTMEEMGAVKEALVGVVVMEAMVKKTAVMQEVVTETETAVEVVVRPRCHHLLLPRSLLPALVDTMLCALHSSWERR